MTTSYPEDQAVFLSRPTAAPDALGWTVLIAHEQPASFVRRFQAAWAVVARWGTLADSDAPWPPDDELLEELPPWFSAALSAEFGSWLMALDEREWRVWSVALVPMGIRVDLSTEGLPLDDWALWVAVETLGGRVLRSNVWIPPA